MTTSQLAEYFQKLEHTTSRIKITHILAELFAKATPKEIGKICYLILGELTPAYRGLEFHLAEKMMVRALALACGEKEEYVQNVYQQEGDLGNAIYKIQNSKSKIQMQKSRNKGKKLSVNEVYERLLEIAKESGEGSQERKITKMARLLAELDPLSAKFVARIPVGKLRLGFSDVTILDALSVMERGDKSARKEIEKAYNVTADIGAIARKVKEEGISALSRVRAEPGIPIRPSLAERVPTAKEIIEKLGPKVAFEPKLDGFRTAIHVWHEHGKKEVALFSRNLENTTHMFPEIAEGARRLPVHNCILDGETIGRDPKTGKFVPFQETVQRKRKYGIEEMAKKIPLTVFVFDVLYLNGRSLLELKFSERRKILEKVFDGYEGTLRLVEQAITDNPEILEKELEKVLAEGLEGLVVKNLESPYEAGARGFHWVKLKASSAALTKARAGQRLHLLDTIDCVVMGAYKGRGKRAAFGVGGFLLGVRGNDGKYYTISKLGSGLSDEQFREAARRIEGLRESEMPKEYVVTKEEVPDIWIRPSLVIEVLADEVTLSPRHTAGRKGERGYSLRFPRLVKFRDDKNPEDATTVAEIEKMHRAQKS
jgi:DNA ligase-1